MYNHARTVVIAATLALLAMIAWQLLGFANSPTVEEMARIINQGEWVRP